MSINLTKTSSSEIVDDEMDEELVTDYGQMLRSHTNYVLINKILLCQGKCMS